MNKQLQSFRKKLSQKDRIELVQTYYKDKSFRVLLKNADLGYMLNILAAAGSSGGSSVNLSDTYYPWKGIYGPTDFVFDPSVGLPTLSQGRVQFQSNDTDLGTDFIATVAFDTLPIYGFNLASTSNGLYSYSICLTNTIIPSVQNAIINLEGDIQTAINTFPNHVSFVYRMTSLYSTNTPLNESYLRQGVPGALGVAPLFPTFQSNLNGGVSGPPFMLQYRYNEITSKISINRIYMSTNIATGALSYLITPIITNVTLAWSGPKYIVIGAEHTSPIIHDPVVYLPPSTIPIKIRIFKGELPTPTLTLFPNASRYLPGFDPLLFSTGPWGTVKTLPTNSPKLTTWATAKKPSYEWDWEFYLRWGQRAGTGAIAPPDNGIAFVSALFNNASFGSVNDTPSQKLAFIAPQKGWCYQLMRAGTTPPSNAAAIQGLTGTVNTFNTSSIARTQYALTGWVIKNVVSGLNCTVSFEYVSAIGTRTMMFSYTDTIVNMTPYHFGYFAGDLGATGIPYTGYSMVSSVEEINI